jgi:hypothetical protein
MWFIRGNAYSISTYPYAHSKYSYSVMGGGGAKIRVLSTRNTGLSSWPTGTHGNVRSLPAAVYPTETQQESDWLSNRNPAHRDF